MVARRAMGIVLKGNIVRAGIVEKLIVGESARAREHPPRAGPDQGRLQWLGPVVLCRGRDVEEPEDAAGNTLEEGELAHASARGGACASVNCSRVSAEG